MRTIVLFGITSAFVFLCLALAAPFLPAVTWALALSIVAHPLHARMLNRFPGRPDMVALISTAIVTICILAPVVIIVQQTMREASSGISALQHAWDSGSITASLRSDPRLAPVLDWLGSSLDIKKEIDNLSALLSRSVGQWIQGTLWIAIQLLIAVFLLFYLFRDRFRALQSLRSYLPLSRREADELFERIRSMVHATVYGTLTVASIQGILGGLMFWFLGLPAPLLWGALMSLFAIVPVVGTFVVWLPAAGFLASQGHWGKSVILILWGTLVVSMIDNLLYPILVGKEIRMHTVPVFIAIAGGLALFGISGLVLGPVALVTAINLVDTMSRRTVPKPVEPERVP